MGIFRYKPLADQVREKHGTYNQQEQILVRFRLYNTNSNSESLIDCANFCMTTYMTQKDSLKKGKFSICTHNDLISFNLSKNEFNKYNIYKNHVYNLIKYFNDNREIGPLYTIAAECMFEYIFNLNEKSHFKSTDNTNIHMEKI